jgi:A/G-specific adenine glycosylase
MKRAKDIQTKIDRNFIHLVHKHWKKYGRHDLPWRKSITSYRILVSEIMLQQTQVSRVLPKFSLWMKQYPSLNALSHASLKDILILWQGLGYQRRAKALYAIANRKQLFPKRYEDIITLPGIGRYTASAIVAFAHNTLGYPLLETNIRTALVEHFHGTKQVVHDELLYEDLYRLEHYSAVKNIGARFWYYALMDYGAYLKANAVSHNDRVKGYKKQTPYKGSFRELRAKVLFAIAHNQSLPEHIRTKEAVQILVDEGYIHKRGKKYTIL